MYKYGYVKNREDLKQKIKNLENITMWKKFIKKVKERQVKYILNKILQETEEKKSLKRCD
jgi:ABC-type transport system involved in cytochrome c biogenesis ATPase subunit